MQAAVQRGRLPGPGPGPPAALCRRLGRSLTLTALRWARSLAAGPRAALVDTVPTCEAAGGRRQVCSRPGCVSSGGSGGEGERRGRLCSVHRAARPSVIEAEPPQAMESMDPGRELYLPGMCYHRSHPHLMQKCFSCVLDIIGYTLDAEHVALFFPKTCLEVLE